MYFAGQGSQLQRGQSTATPLPIPSLDTFDAMTLFSALKLPIGEKNVKFFKTLDSAASRSVGGGLKEMKMSFRMVYDPESALHRSIRDEGMSGTQTKRNWRCILPDSGNEQWDFVGFVSKVDPSPLENEDEHAFDVEVTIDGNVTITQ